MKNTQAKIVQLCAGKSGLPLTGYRMLTCHRPYIDNLSTGKCFGEDMSGQMEPLYIQLVHFEHQRFTH